MEIIEGNVYNVIMGVKCKVKVEKVTDTSVEFRYESKRSKSGWTSYTTSELKESFIKSVVSEQ
jgi:hypothetical protein